MAPGAVCQREGYLVVTSSAPLALYDAGHGHVVLPSGRYKYLRVADLALEPVCMHLVRVDDVIHEVALRLDEHIHLEWRHFVGLAVE